MEKKKDRSNYIGMFALAMVLVGNVVGVSFSTGREAMTYFVNFGQIGLVGMVITYSLIFLFGYMAYATSKNMDKYTFDWVITPLGWTPLRIFNITFTLLGLFSALSAMFAGTGAILEAIFGVPFIVGALFMATASVLTVFLSLKKLTDTFKIMIPIMVVLALGVCFVCAVWPSVEGSGWHSVSSNNALLSTWWISALVYFGLQAGPVIQLITPMSQQIKDKKNAMIGSIIAGVVIFLVQAVLAFSIAQNYSIAAEAELPVVTLSFSKDPILGILYCFVAILAIYSTTAAFLHIFKASLNNIKALQSNPKKLNVTLVVLTFLAVSASFIGFSIIVDKVYAVIGYFAFLGAMGLAINFFYYRKHPQNKETAVKN